MDKLTHIVRRAIRWSLRCPLYALCLSLIIALIVYIFILQQTNMPEDVHRALDDIFIGSVSAISTFAIIQYFFIENAEFGIRQWLNIGPSNIWIVPTYRIMPDSGSREYFVTPPFDGQATGIMVEVLKSTGNYYPNKRIIGSHYFNDSVVKDNIVIVGLPNKNIYSRVFLGLLNLKQELDAGMVLPFQQAEIYISDSKLEKKYYGLIYDIDGDNIICKINIGGEYYVSDMDKLVDCIHEPNKLYKDYGVIIKIKNPFNPQSTTLIMGGIHGVATLGCSLHIHRHANQINEKYGGAPQILVVEVDYTLNPGTKNYVDSTILNTRIVDYSLVN